MKKLLLVALFGFSSIANAAVELVEGPIALIKGTSVVSTHSDLGSCVVAANEAASAESDASKKNTRRFCRLQLDYLFKPPIPVISITATPAQIAIGSSSLLTWNVSGAVGRCTKVGAWTGTATLNGSLLVKTAGSYGLQCKNASGTVDGSTSVVVNEPPPVVPACKVVEFEDGESSWVTVNTVTDNGIRKLQQERYKVVIHEPSNCIDPIANLTETRLIDAPAEQLWLHAANEGYPTPNSIKLYKATKARYGIEGYWNTFDLQPGTYAVGNERFGPDPIEGTPKVLEIDNPDALIDPTSPPHPDHEMPQTPGMFPASQIKLAPSAVGFTTLRIQPTDHKADPGGAGQGSFRNPCGYSHMAFDDPIVYPGEEGKAHLHTFFGNTSTNAHTTSASLKAAGSSTCAGGIANLSAYWVPTMIDTMTGEALVPFDTLFYYKNNYGTKPANTVSPPNGLRFIGGNPLDRSANVAWGVRAIFNCNADWYTHGQHIVDCAPGGFLEQSLLFPSCWDGVNLDSPDHRSHMAYSNNDACPASHPVAIPEVGLNIAYRVKPGQDTTKWRLSSDSYDTSLPGGFTTHADIWFMWDEKVRDTWMNNCVRVTMDCHGYLLGDGTSTY